MAEANDKPVLPDLFASLPEEVVQEINRHRVENHYNKGQILFEEEAPASGLFFLHSGHVKLYKTGVDGKQQIVSIAGPDDILGYRSLFKEESFPVTAQALDESHVSRIEKKVLLPLLSENAGLSLALLKRIIDQLNEAEELMTSIAQRSVQERMAKLLLMLKEAYGQPTEAGVSIKVQLSHEEIGEMVGITRETATRVLSRFREEKMIDIENREIRILDSGALAETAKIS